MERFRVELISVEDLVVNAENIEEACQWARNFIANQAKVDGPRYKLHANYSSTPEAPP